MISKKVITQTIPTVYNDNEEFMIARDSFNGNTLSSVTANTSNSKVKPMSTGSNFNFNPSNNFNKTTNTTATIRKMNISLNNGAKRSNEKLATNSGVTVNPVSFFDFHVKNENDFSTLSKKSSEKHKKPAQFSNKAFNLDNAETSPTASIPTTPFQNTFQKFVIERHVNHFNHRQPSLNSGSSSNTKQITLEKKYVSEESPLTTAGIINSLNDNMTNYYNKSYFYSENNKSDPKSLNESDRVLIKEKVSGIFFSSV
jgi:hypothetical protein